MSKFVGLDRENPPRVPGDLIKEWERETAEVRKRVIRDATCPNCGFLMAYGVPCSTSPKPTGDT